VIQEKATINNTKTIKTQSKKSIALIISQNPTIRHMENTTPNTLKKNIIVNLKVILINTIENLVKGSYIKR